VILGLAAALGWGASDLVAAITARRIGSRATVVVAQIVGLVCFGVVWLVTTPPWRMPAHDVVALIVSGCFAGVAYAAMYRGLELGPVALVSPIASAFASVTVVLAILVLGESPGVGRLLGVVLTILGVVLASTDLRQFEIEARRHKRGLPYALAAMGGFGVAAFATGSLAKDYGWLPPITVSRVGSLAFILVVTAVARWRGDVDRERRGWPPLSGVALAGVAGIGDVVGIAAYARGSEIGLISIVAAASATFTLIPVAGGILLFGERPAANQFVGLACVIGGLLLVGAQG
jgi:drug/metabolite transporter (DMT)-like permease